MTTHHISYQHIPTHTHTHKHTQHRHITHSLNTSSSPAKIQTHFIPFCTRLAQEFLDKCFLYDANMFAQQGMGQGTFTLALGASQSRVYRESQLDECSLSSSLRTVREGRQETERERKRDEQREYEKRERHMREDRCMTRERVTDKEIVCPRRSRVYIHSVVEMRWVLTASVLARRSFLFPGDIGRTCTARTGVWCLSLFQALCPVFVPL